LARIDRRRCCNPTKARTSSASSTSSASCQAQAAAGSWKARPWSGSAAEGKAWAGCAPPRYKHLNKLKNPNPKTGNNYKNEKLFFFFTLSSTSTPAASARHHKGRQKIKRKEKQCSTCVFGALLGLDFFFRRTTSFFFFNHIFDPPYREAFKNKIKTIGKRKQLATRRKTP
jgi:hypothetical protein